MKHMPAAFAAAPRDWFKIQLAATEDDEPLSADVYIYEQIGENWWGGGIGAKKFAEQIDALDVDTIFLHLNSPGGAAWEGITIMNSLRRHRARVEVTVDGLAASAASVIAMAGDRITMNRGAQMMVHDAWGFAIGNAGDMQETAEILSKLSDSIADTYAARAGKGREHWRAIMQAETWYTAEEAVEAGLADDWVDAPAASASFDLSKLGFAYAGREHAPAPRIEIPIPPDSTEPGNPNQKEELNMSDTIKAGLRERLGVTDAEASEETLLAALDEALEERAETPTLPEGVVVMDAAALEELRANAALGAEARAQQQSDRRDGIVAKALAEGRIAPASAADWRAQLDTDEDGISKLLNSFAANTVPVTEVGHADTVTSADDALYAAAFGAEKKEA